jgi:hypothetical protein
MDRQGHRVDRVTLLGILASRLENRGNCHKRILSKIIIVIMHLCKMLQKSFGALLIFLIYVHTVLYSYFTFSPLHPEMRFCVIMRYMVVHYLPHIICITICVGTFFVCC